MRIKKMTATFGALDSAVLEPDSGLTVIAAPNEAGKSTWAEFLKAMLYGIDTRERDKTGCQPWSGAPMSGEMQVEWQGKDVTIRRFPTRTDPFGGFEAVYTATGDPVPGLTAANVGEQLTGVGREVYLRSAFVEQGGAAIASSKELARLEERQKELQSDLEIWDRLERHDLNRRYAEAYMEWETAQAAIPEDKPHPVFGVMTGEDARAFARQKQAARAAADAARRRVDDLAAQGGQLFDTLELLHPPAQSKAATAAQLASVQRELARVRDELALTAPDAPLVLDDALAAFDDVRCASALELLKSQSAERQILLFTCHSREAQWAEAHNVSVLKL